MLSKTLGFFICFYFFAFFRGNKYIHFVFQLFLLDRRGSGSDRQVVGTNSEGPLSPQASDAEAGISMGERPLPSMFGGFE